MTKLILIRHGETDWNLEKRWQGQVDIPLNARGVEQARQIAEKLRDLPIRAIFASDLQRAYHTAKMLSSLINVPIQTDHRLREIHQGEWQGMRIGEIEAKYNQQLIDRRKDARLIAPPGGETTEQVHKRVVAALEEILSKYPNETVAVFSHGFAIAVARTHFVQHNIDAIWDLVPKNGEIVTLDLESDP